MSDVDLEWLVASDIHERLDIAYTPGHEPEWRDSPRGPGGKPGRRMTSGGLPLAIRARQGHSLPGIDPSKTFLEMVTPDSYQSRMGKPITGAKVFHSTYPGCCPTIMNIGIYPGGLSQNRRAVYLSPVEPDDSNDDWLPGMRSDAPYVVEMSAELLISNVQCYWTSDMCIATEEAIHPCLIERIWLKDEERRSAGTHDIWNASKLTPGELANWGARAAFRPSFLTIEDLRASCGGLPFAECDAELLSLIHI